MTDVLVTAPASETLTLTQLADLIKAHRLLHVGTGDQISDYHCDCGEWKAGALDSADRNVVLHSWELHVAEVLAAEGLLDTAGHITQLEAEVARLRDQQVHNYDEHAGCLDYDNRTWVPGGDYDAKVEEVAALRDLVNKAETLIDAKNDAQTAVEAELRATQRLVEHRVAAAEANVVESYAGEAYDTAKAAVDAASPCRCGSRETTALTPGEWIDHKPDECRIMKAAR